LFYDAISLVIDIIINKKIDYIFYSKDLFKLKSVTVTKYVYHIKYKQILKLNTNYNLNNILFPSDHWPLIAELKYIN